MWSFHDYLLSIITPRNFLNLINRFTIDSDGQIGSGFGFALNTMKCVFFIFKDNLFTLSHMAISFRSCSQCMWDHCHSKTSSCQQQIIWVMQSYTQRANHLHIQGATKGPKLTLEAHHILSSGDQIQYCCKLQTGFYLLNNFSTTCEHSHECHNDSVCPEEWNGLPYLRPSRSQEIHSMNEFIHWCVSSDFRKPNWFSYNTENVFEKDIRRLYITFSNTFNYTHNIDTGL